MSPCVRFFLSSYDFSLIIIYGISCCFRFILFLFNSVSSFTDFLPPRTCPSHLGAPFSDFLDSPLPLRLDKFFRLWAWLANVFRFWDKLAHFFRFCETSANFFLILRQFCRWRAATFLQDVCKNVAAMLQQQFGREEYGSISLIGQFDCFREVTCAGRRTCRW